MWSDKKPSQGTKGLTPLPLTASLTPRFPAKNKPCMVASGAPGSGRIYCSAVFRLRDQGQRQSPAKTTHLTHASNTRTLGEDVKCLTAVGEPQV